LQMPVPQAPKKTGTSENARLTPALFTSLLVGGADDLSSELKPESG